jgi:hypothetical protein
LTAIRSTIREFVARIVGDLEREFLMTRGHDARRSEFLRLAHTFTPEEWAMLDHVAPSANQHSRGHDEDQSRLTSWPSRAITVPSGAQSDAASKESGD